MTAHSPGPVMTADDLTAFLDAEFPGRDQVGPHIDVEDVDGAGMVMLRMRYEERLLRPGATISGPALFALADIGIYVGVLAAIGPVPLAVTTNATINFLARPKQTDVIAHVSLIKLGKRLAVGEARMFSDGDDTLIAHAVATYSIPPRG